MTHEEFQARYRYDYNTDLLGEGGFGTVFRAYDTYRDRRVAIKIAAVRPELEAVRLRKEVEMVSQLPAHPNIAFYEDCYTFREMSGEYDFGILQYYEQGNLQQLLQREQLTDGQKHALLRQILAGILFLHANGIIHRDLKPQNILIVKRDSEYIPKITDFGISKKLDINRSSVFNNSLMGAGTLAYSSPEQLGSREIRKNTDLWSFGVIAFQTLTGTLPFTTGEHATTGESGRMELFRQISAGTLPGSIMSVPSPWRKLIRRCLTTAPEQRIKDVAACQRILNGESEDGSPTPQPAPQPSPQEQPTRPNIPPPVTRMDAPQPASPEQPTRPNVPSPAPSPAPGKKRMPVLIAVGVAGVLLGVAAVWLLQRTPNSPAEPLKHGTDSTAIARTTEPAVPAPSDNVWEADYNRTVKSADAYYKSKKYAEAKAEYSKALAQIPATDKGNRRNIIKGKIADCDRQLKEEANTTTANMASSKEYDEKADLFEDLVRVKLNGKYGVIDKTGKEVIPVKYDNITHSAGLLSVKLNGKEGYIDRTGKAVTPLKYEKVFGFESVGLASVKLNGKYGYIDRTGKEVIPLKYDDVWSFSEGLAKVELNGKYGFIDRTGKEVIPLKYDEALSFNEGLAWVKLNGKKFYIDRTGNLIPQEEDVEETIPFAIVEIKPMFQGKDAESFRDWIYSQIGEKYGGYPAEALENNIQGTVRVSFTVNTDGTLSDIKSTRNVNPILENAVLEIVKQSPKWTPGSQQHKPVKVPYQVPVVFKIQS